MLLSGCAALCLGQPPAIAGGLKGMATPAASDVAQISVLPGWRTAQGTHMTALRIRLAPGWKTYWRAPGDAGIPPRFDWRQSENLSAIDLHWPVPHVFDQNGMRTVGYKDELVLPIELTPSDPGAPIALRADIELGVCRDVCMPMSVRVSADLGTTGRDDGQIGAAMAQRPFTGAEAGLASARCAVEPIRDGLRITATLALPPLGPQEVALFEHADQRIWVSESDTRRSGGELVAVTEMVAPTGKPFALDRSDIRITVLSGGQAVDIRGCTGG